MSEIQKVQYKGDSVKIWIKAHENAKDADNFEGLNLKSQCNSKDEPRNEFKAVFTALQNSAVQAMAAEDSWSDCDLTIHTVSFVEKDGDLAGAVFQGVIWITEHSMMSFKTPIAWFKQPEDKECITLGIKQAGIVKNLLKETEKYFQGERAQVEMQLDDQAA